MIKKMDNRHYPMTMCACVCVYIHTYIWELMSVTSSNWYSVIILTDWISVNSTEPIQDDLWN